ncbi:MAG: hypothetical protein ACRDZU_12165, partial [Acidimicrobiales bacterium]
HVPSLVSDSLVHDEGNELAHAVEAPPPVTEEDEKELLVAKVAELEDRLAELELATVGGVQANGNGTGAVRHAERGADR